MTNSHFSKIFCQFAKKHFTKCGGFWHYFAVVAKSTAEPENSNHLSVAQNTPIACFFMRSAHAPQERLARPSMVACSGKGFALCCFPLMTVSQPVTRYRPSLRTLAVTSNQFFSGVTQMYQFIFAGIRRTDLTNRIQKIRIQAESELQARAILAREFVLVLAGRINLKNLSNFDRALTGRIYA
nr:host cell division inhibitor Icd-like protein [Necropsobacter massiliensis]